MKGARHIEILGDLPGSTLVPRANGSDDCANHHTRTIGLQGGIRNTLRVPLSADGVVTFKQETPERDLFYET